MIGGGKLKAGFDYVERMDGQSRDGSGAEAGEGLDGGLGEAMLAEHRDSSVMEELKLALRYFDQRLFCCVLCKVKSILRSALTIDIVMVNAIEKPNAS